jgi:hypothetical protein
MGAFIAVQPTSRATSTIAEVIGAISATLNPNRCRATSGLITSPDHVSWTSVRFGWSNVGDMDEK